MKLKIEKVNISFNSIIVSEVELEGKGNLFDENVFSEKLTIQELKFSSFISIIKSKLLLYIIYIILIIVIISTFYTIVPPVVTLIFLFVFISFLIFTMVIPDIYKWKKRNNKISKKSS